MRFCADNVTSGDMDEIQAIRKVYAELKSVDEAIRAEVAEDVAAQRASTTRVMSLQQATRALMTQDFSRGITAASSDLEAVEPMPCEAYALHTGKKPLSMYTASQWAMCFPQCFPYGDGAFGLPRETRLTFQQWSSMIILREELVYQVAPEHMHEAEQWFLDAGATFEIAAAASSQRAASSAACPSAAGR